MIGGALAISTSGVAVVVATALLIGVLGGFRWRAAGRRPGVPRPSRRWITPACIGFGAVIAGASLIAAVPVRASGTTSGPVGIEPAAGASQAGIPAPPVDMEIRVRAEPGVQLYLPGPISTAIDQGLPGVDVDGWSRLPDDPRVLVADRADGSVLTLRGRFPALELTFVTGPGAGSVDLDASGAVTALDLEAPTTGATTVRVNGGTTRSLASTPFGWSGHTLLFDRPVDTLESATIGLLPVRVAPVLDESGDVIGARVDLRASIRALGRSALHLTTLIAAAIAIAAAGALVGAACGQRRVNPGAVGWFRRTTYGLAVSMLLVGALNYLVPVRWAIWVVVPLIAYGAIRVAQERPLPNGPDDDDDVPRKPAELGVWISVIVVGAIQVVWFLLSDRWALGFLQTDVFDTFNVTELFWRESALDASIAFGDGFRLLDYSTRAGVAGVMLDRPSDAIVVLRLLFAVLVAAMAAGFVSRRGLPTWVQVGTALIASSGSAFVGLYAEGYMSREFFTSWMLLGLFAIAHQLLDGSRGFRPWWTVGVISCVALAIVPPYFVIAPAVLASVAAATVGPHWRAVLGEWRTAMGGYALAILTFGLPNLVWLRSASDADQYIDALNALVRNIGVPFYASARLPGAMIGLLPFHHQDGYPLGGSTIAIGPFRWDTDWLAGAVVVGVVLVGLGVLFVTALWVIGRSRPGQIDRSVIALWAATVIAYLGGLAALRVVAWNEQTYFTIMWIWTLAPVALAALSIVLSEAARVTGWSRAVMLTAVGLLAAVNVMSATGESVLWVESGYSERAPKWHYDLANGIEHFDRALRSDDVDLTGDGFAVVIDQPSALTGSDDDRVLVNVLSNLLEADGRTCEQCNRNADFYWLTASTERPKDADYLLVGSIDCGSSEPLYVDEYFAMCGATE